jgi:RNA polymerase sigma-70 factor (ECF subfamily)
VNNSTRSVTVLLRAAEQGESQAIEQLFRTAFPALRRMARSLLKNERTDHTLQPTALVDEVFLKLIVEEDHRWVDREEFFGLAARRMRQILVDYARHRKCERRGGGVPHVSSSDVPIPDELNEDLETLVSLDQLLNRLATLDPRAAKIAEFRFYWGMSSEEIARKLYLTVKTVERDWAFARAWLYSNLYPERAAQIDCA